MPSRLHPAEPEIYEVLGRVLKSQPRFTPLIDAEVNVEIQMAYNLKGGPAIKHHGCPALAKIKVVGPEERCKGGPDVRLLVDGERFHRLPPIRRQATFAHELYHLVLVEKKDGSLKRDDYGRPVVKMRPDDWTINGFREVFEWYGEDAIERITWKAVGEYFNQPLFVFMSRNADDDLPGSIEDEDEHPPTVAMPAPAEPPAPETKEVFACNRCNINRPATVHPCPDCHCPEFRIVEVPKAEADELAAAHERKANHRERAAAKTKPRKKAAHA